MKAYDQRVAAVLLDTPASTKGPEHARPEADQAAERLRLTETDAKHDLARLGRQTVNCRYVGWAPHRRVASPLHRAPTLLRTVTVGWRHTTTMA
jgi:hypothetical protein